MSSFRFCAAFALSFLLLLGVLPAHAGVADDLKRSLQRLDRSICHEFKGKGCKSAARKKKTARKGGSTTPTAKKPVAKVETAPTPALPLETSGHTGSAAASR